MELTTRAGIFYGCMAHFPLLLCKIAMEWLHTGWAEGAKGNFKFQKARFNITRGLEEDVAAARPLVPSSSS